MINLGFDPPGSNLPHHLRYIRHIEFDHYRPVADSGAVMVARSLEDMREMLLRGLRQPEADSAKRRQFIRDMFGRMVNGGAAQRIAEHLLQLVQAEVKVHPQRK